ncbi:MAG: universal stress protein [Proteobacteria bacterium]|nr:universal stress protein [Pseudomonadota bacterium]
MHILHAIEKASLAEDAVRLVSALDFTEASIALVHVLQRLEPPLKSTHGEGDLVTGFYKLQEEAAEEELAAIRNAYQQLGIPSEVLLVSGFTVSALLQEASRLSTNLLVVSVRPRSRLEQLLTQSITGTLIHKAPQSLLIARGNFQRDQRIRALIATDHSEYCTHALERLIQFAPRGLAAATVVSCFSAQLRRALASADEVAAQHEKARWSAHLEGQNQRVLRLLEPLGVPIESLVATQTPGDIIPKLIEEQGYNLLILGAHGHGFFERLGIGSVTHELFSKTNCSLMVLRSA